MKLNLLYLILQIHNVVRSVQKSYGLSPEIAKQLIQELSSQLSIKKSIFTAHQEVVPNNIDQSIQTSMSSRPKILSAFQTKFRKFENEVDPLYIITPTYRRPEQIPELTRMSHTLMLVKNINWLVIEDAKVPTKQVTKLLEKTGLQFVHLVG